MSVAIGITGNVASGKTFVSRCCRSVLRMPVFDADREVRRLYHCDPKVLAYIKDEFPEAFLGGGARNIKMSVFLEAMISNDPRFAPLLTLLHGGVIRLMFSFLQRWRSVDFVALEIPLLFEIALEQCFDYTIHVSANYACRRSRFLASHGCSNALNQFEACEEHQFLDSEKRRHACYIIKNELSKENALLQLKRIMHDIAKRSSKAI